MTLPPVPASRPLVSGRFLPVRLRLLAVLIAAAAGPACAIDIDTGNPDMALRWDNTVKYSVAGRLKSADPVIVSNPNGDDGDRNFGKGLISNRVDWLTEADVTFQRRFGARVSGAAWYDRAYMRHNDNPGFAGGAFPNQISVPSDEFTAATKKVHGRDAEVLDAFVFGKFDLGETTLGLRAGRHAMVWGESLFFGANGIAGGMMPVDVVKLMSVPSTQFKEAIRPVPMVSAQWQLTPNVTMGGYVQTGWVGNRTAASGSYFSNTDPAVDGAETILTGPASVALREGDLKPKRGGQWGLQLRLRSDDTDYGVYLLNYHAKSPQLVPRMTLVMPPAVPVPTPVPVSYYLGYQQDIRALGASASRTFGVYNVAIEVSLRDNMDLASRSSDLSAFLPVPATDNRDNPGFAVGRTAHVNLNTLASLPENGLWREATLAAEMAWNRMLSVNKNAASLDPNGTRDGWALRMLLEPMYRSVLPGVDLSVPLGLGWAPKGARPLASGNPNAWIAENGGDLSVGLNGSYHDALRFSLSWTHYLGSASPFTDATGAYTWQQSLRDRDFIAASVRYAF